MRSDTPALLSVFLLAGVVVLAVMAKLSVAALGQMNREAAAAIAAAVLVVGGILVG